MLSDDSVEKIARCRGDAEKLDDVLTEIRLYDLKYILKSIKSTFRGKDCKQIRRRKDHEYMQSRLDICESAMSMKMHNIKSTYVLGKGDGYLRLWVSYLVC